MASPVKDRLEPKTADPIVPDKSKQRHQDARARSASLNSLPYTNLMSELKRTLRVPPKGTEEKKAPAQRVQQATSFLLKRPPPKSEYWEGVYDHPFFNEEKQFEKAILFVISQLENKNLDATKIGIYTLIKNAGYLFKHDPSKTLNEAVRNCLSKRAIEITMPGVAMEKAQGVLDSFLKELLTSPPVPNRRGFLSRSDQSA